jgi:hypothetical protein
MTIEFILCALMAVIALPASRAIAIHYAVYAGVNLMYFGVEYADASLLALTFSVLAAIDGLLFSRYWSPALLVSAIAAAALSIESMFNKDWLLSHVGYISAAVNAVIVLYLAREYKRWTMGRFGR